MKTKKCSKCGLVKPVEDFGKDKSQEDGYNRKCKKCINIDYRNYYKKHAKEEIKRHEKYRNDCKEREFKYDKKYHDDCKVMINYKNYNINTAPPELKPILEALILIRKKQKFIKEAKSG